MKKYIIIILLFIPFQTNSYSPEIKKDAILNEILSDHPNYNTWDANTKKIVLKMYTKYHY